jgi:hypothetical protein
MTNSNHVSCIHQHGQIHMCNILSDLTIMLIFLVIIYIVIFVFSHDGHILSFHTTIVF